MRPQLPAGSCFASVTVPSQISSIRLAAAFIVGTARNMQVPQASEALFEVAVVEALNNAVLHGNAANRPEALMVCELELADHRLIIRLYDQGQGFVIPDRAGRTWSADDRSTVPEGGFGLPLIANVFSTVSTFGRPGEFGVELTMLISGETSR